MSKKTVPTVCLVVDTSVARSAGPPATNDARGQACRDFLIAMRGAGHRLAFSPAIQAEWLKHMSGFSTLWLASMVSLRKVQLVAVDAHEEFREAVDEHSPNDGVKRAVIKDAHLVETAMASDKRVASLDDTVRGHLARLTTHCKLIKPLLWVNPDQEDEQVIAWLSSGAPNELKRQLGRYRPESA